MTDSGVPMLAVIFPLEGQPWVTRTGSESELRALGAWIFRPSADRRVIDCLSALADALAEVEAEADES